MAHMLHTSQILQPDREAWVQYFEEMTAGRMDNAKPFYRLKKRSKVSEGSKQSTPEVNMVTPAAQMKEAAQSAIEDEKKQSVMTTTQAYNTAGRKVGRAPAGNRKKAKVLKDIYEDDDDIFA